MTLDIYIAIAVAFFSSIVACEFAHRRKDIQRGIYARLAVLAFSGFAGALLSMIVISISEQFEILIALFCGSVYGYVMANAKALERVR